MSILLRLALVGGGALATAFAAKQAVTIIVRDKALASALMWPLFLRSANRIEIAGDNRWNCTGFRVARSLPPPRMP